jgi:uncharacterized protein (TIGR02996 family)
MAGSGATEGRSSMTRESGFLRAILDNPADDTPRLVYADWLEERGDPRGEYLRLDVALAGRGADSPEAVRLRERMLEVRTRIEPTSLARLEQPRVLRANPTPFPSAWWSIGLKGLRERRGTYTLYPYDSLPALPVESLRGEFRWLRNCDPLDRIGDVELQEWQASQPAEIAHVVAAAEQLGVELPGEFLAAMRDVDLLRRMRSCTACYFNLPARVEPSPRGEGGYLVRFYSDSQSCLHWYLYVTRRGYHCVVVSREHFGGAPGWEPEPDPTAGRQDAAEFWFCAPSFEAFLYRFWIENEIWYSLYHDHDPLTPDEQTYVDHYRR